MTITNASNGYGDAVLLESFNQTGRSLKSNVGDWTRFTTTSGPTELLNGGGSLNSIIVNSGSSGASITLWDATYIESGSIYDVQISQLGPLVISASVTASAPHNWYQVSQSVVSGNTAVKIGTFNVGGLTTPTVVNANINLSQGLVASFTSSLASDVLVSYA